MSSRPQPVVRGLFSNLLRRWGKHDPSIYTPVENREELARLNAQHERLEDADEEYEMMEARDVHGRH